jgi:hypothetical protein
MADILTDLDNALYDEDEKKIDRYAFEMEDLLLDLIDLELDILDRTERFVSAYVDY